MHTYIDIYTLTPTLESHIYMYTYIYIHKCISIHILHIYKHTHTLEFHLTTFRDSGSFDTFTSRFLQRTFQRSVQVCYFSLSHVQMSHSYIKKRHIAQTLAFLALCFSERECVAYVMSHMNIAVSMSQRVAVCCSVLQCVAVCCSVLHMSCHI